jgi:hypothetical protein
MSRLIAVLSFAALAACSSKPAPGGGAQGSGSAATPAGSGSAAPAAAAAPAPRPASVLDQVQQWAPQGTKVAAAPADLAVPGVELFVVSDASPPADERVGMGKLVGVAGGVGGAILDGRDLVKAAVAALAPGARDGAAKPAAKPARAKRGRAAPVDPGAAAAAKTLARVALWVAQDDGELLDHATSREQKKARVTAPALGKDSLAFWVWTTDQPAMLERGVLTLATGALELELVTASPAVAISNAMTTLGSDRVSRHVVAIRTLADACSDTRARQALMSALVSHPRLKTRIAIAEEARRCGPAAVDGLITAMEQDRAAVVRSEAARALGRIGDSRARPALAKAVRGQDANLAYAAGNALKKLN